KAEGLSVSFSTSPSSRLNLVVSLLSILGVTLESRRLSCLESRRLSRISSRSLLNPNKKDLTELPRNVPSVPSGMFFSHNTNMVPPYRVLVDTNFINFSIQNKIDIEQGMMFCLNAKCTPCITDCVMAELEKLGQKYCVALRIAKDPRFERLPCVHKRTYADDCLVDRVTQHKCFMVATCDRDLKRRIRKVPGVPIMYLAGRKYSVEKLPEATLGRGMHLFGLL
ncbi:hypothetical protein F2Q69_00015078, partial [Brassica cretica]